MKMRTATISGTASMTREQAHIQTGLRFDRMIGPLVTPTPEIAWTRVIVSSSEDCIETRGR
jgi:hypothetical protein